MSTTVTNAGNPAQAPAGPQNRDNKPFVHRVERTATWANKATGERRTQQVLVVGNCFGEVGVSLEYVSARIDRAPRPVQAS